MCVHRKKGGATNKKAGTPATATPTSQTPKTQPLKGPQQKQKDAKRPAAKNEVEAKNDGENILAKPMGKDEKFKEEKAKTPLHIRVPPPRIMKAKRPMKEVRSARDPEYKTLELDISEWESVKIMKRSEINPDDIVKKDFKDVGGEHKDAVEAAA